MPNPVSEVIRFGVGSILAVCHVPGAACFDELSSSQGEERAQEPAFCIHSRHGGEGERIGRTHEVEQHGFCLIVALVGRDDVGRAALEIAGFGAQPFEVGITDFPGFRLHAVLGRIHLGVEHMTRDATCRTPFFDQRLVCIGGFAAQVVVHVCDVKIDAHAVEGFGQNHGVQAAADTGDECGVGIDALPPKPLPHVLHQSVAVIRHRPSKFASSLLPSVGIRRIHSRDRSRK